MGRLVTRSPFLFADREKQKIPEVLRRWPLRREETGRVILRAKLEFP
jgi:hypothetical protein